MAVNSLMGDVQTSAAGKSGQFTTHVVPGETGIDFIVVEKVGPNSP
jgi:hypothetical protein